MYYVVAYEGNGAVPPLATVAYARRVRTGNNKRAFGDTAR